MKKFDAGVRSRIEGHAAKGHRLELKVTDRDSSLRCVYCGQVIARSSNGEMRSLEHWLMERQIDFDVYCYSADLPDVEPDLFEPEEKPLIH